MSMPNKPEPEGPARMQPGARVWIGGHDRAARRFVERWLSGFGASRPAEGPIDAAFITPESLDEAVYFLTKLTPRLTAQARVNVIYRMVQADPASGARPPSTDEWKAALGSLGWSVVDIWKERSTVGWISATRMKGGPAPECDE